MSKKMIAVVVGAALVAVVALTATAWAVGGVPLANAGAPLASVVTTPTPGAHDTSGSPEPTAPHAPWATSDATVSVPTSGSPFGWTVRMLAMIPHGADATGTPFGQMISRMAQAWHSFEATPGVRTMPGLGRMGRTAPMGPRTRSHATAPATAPGPMMRYGTPTGAPTQTAPSGTAPSGGMMSGSGGMMGSRW